MPRSGPFYALKKEGKKPELGPGIKAAGKAVLGKTKAASSAIKKAANKLFK